MWSYIQSTGELIGPDDVRAQGYSGAGVHKNDPDSQNLVDLGPIPCGVYRIGDPQDTAEHGPFVLPLTPDAANEMFGRAGFLIHGDSIEHPGAASEGCIIMPRLVRDRIYMSGDRHLFVMANPPSVVPDPGIESE
jgi:hypothetical protein